VLLLLPPGVSIAHACLAQLFFSTMLAITVFTSKRWQDGPEMVDDHGWPSLRTLAIVVPVVVLAQVALGAAFRHRVLGVMPHVIGAMVVALALMLLGMFVLHQFPAHRSLRSAAHTMLGVTFLQVFLGIAAYFTRLEAATKPTLMVLTTVAHVALGALTLATTIVLSIQIRRNVRAQAAVERETCGGDFVNLIRAYADLTKPRITCFILMSTAIGFLFGMPQGAPFAWPLLLHTLLGTALIASGTAGLNQWYERLADARMNRTKGRPIPSGTNNRERMR
jgi:hypothetical protein